MFAFLQGVGSLSFHLLYLSLCLWVGFPFRRSWFATLFGVTAVTLVWTFGSVFRQVNSTESITIKAKAKTKSAADHAQQPPTTSRFGNLSTKDSRNSAFKTAKLQGIQ